MQKFVVDTNAGGQNSCQFACLFRVLSAMKLQPTSVFCDLGCGFGAPCVAARELFNVDRVRGLDYNDACISFIERNRTDWHWLPTDSFERRDLMSLQMDDLADVTHIFMFDAVFTAATTNHIAALLNSNAASTIEVLVSCFKPDFWDNMYWQLRSKLRGTLCGTGGSTRTFYVYDRRSALHIAEESEKKTSN